MFVFAYLSTGGERKEETWPVPAHSCVLVCCRAHIEQEYWEKDGITEDAIDEFVIRLGEDDDDSSSSDSSDDPSDPESDEELVVPLLMDTDTSKETKMFSK
ncbi:hypothetical protein J6590_083142 [Homalodisca vitripennis]|nr:hypothetical protein J6590_083142 [Homalodisca vitripennis]